MSRSEVVALDWPEQAEEAERLRRLGTPRLLLVPGDVEPPNDSGDLVDWVRVPADEKEVVARVVALMRRSTDRREPPAERPEVDQHGRCVYGDRWIALSPTEAVIAKVLCDRYMEVIPEGDLITGLSRGTDRAPINAGALRVHLTRLRQRIATLGLEVVTIRRQGVVLQRSPV